MPEDLKNAFVSIEDERFYEHNGIDLKRISGVILIDIKSKLKGQSTLQGASTITQQLLKNTLLSSEVSIKRKLQEIYLAVKLEKYLSKDQILEAYMNTIFLGGRANGVEAASQQYFSKKAKDLNLIECAFIAGVTQSPSASFSAVTKKNSPTYINRTQTVLMKMYENGYITQAQYNNGLNDLNNNKLAFQLQLNTNSRLSYEAFSLPAIDQVKKDLKKEYHYSDAEVQHLLMYGGLKIYTTMDKDAEDNTQKLLNNDNILANQTREDKDGKQIPLQASAVVMDYHTGEVKVIIGGRGSQDALSFNRATEVSGIKAFPRRPGSTIKPLTVYGPAIDSKEFTAATSIKDAPLPDNIAKLYGQGGNQYPRNDTNVYGNYGESVTLRTGLMHSLNTIAAGIENQIGLKTGAEYSEKLGLNLDVTDKTSIAALSLGQLTHGTYPLNMAAAYGTFGNNGLYISPKLYRKVVDRNGKALLENKTQTRKAFSPEAAYIMYDLLKGPVSPNGTGPNANFGSMPVRGKTGTSGTQKDLWFCGLTPYYSAAVWLGYDDNSIINGLNSNNAAGVWASIMQPLHENLQPKELEIPQGVVNSVVCEDSGKLPTSACYSDPTGNKTYSELFIDGTVPTDYCNLSHSYHTRNSIMDNLLKPFKDNASNNGSENNNNLNNNNSNNNSNTNDLHPNNNQENVNIPTNNNKNNKNTNTETPVIGN
jgi:penicillin-binding protein 1A